MRLLVVGFGAAGRRYVDVARGLELDVAVARRRASGDEGVPAFTGLDEAERWQPDAVVVTTPTALHPDAVGWAVSRSIHAFVEKPLAARSDGLGKLLDDAERAGVTIAVGYNLRFHPALGAIAAAVRTGRIGRLLSVRAEVGQYLPDWQPEADYTQSYAAQRELGGGALLTLSHELDYVRWIAGEVVACTGDAAQVSSLDLDVDDVAELVCRHEGGAISSVHTDLVDRSYNRRTRWVGETGTITWSWRDPVRLLPDGTELWADEDFALSQTYAAALADFVRAVETGDPPRVTGRDALRLLEICDDVAAR
jgi:predicted dehydrogenase